MKLADLKGLGPVGVKKLENAGITDIMDLIVRGPVEIQEIVGYADKKTAESLCSTARELMADEGVISKQLETGTEVYERRKLLKKIPTGTEAFDNLLGGGVECGSLTEIYGENGSGKTQFCLTLCVMVQKHLGGKVLFIDTENTFRPERIVQIAEANDMDVNETLDNIIIARAYNSAHQYLTLEEAGNTIRENNIKLIISDSGTGLFRAEYVGRSTLSERQGKLQKYWHLMARLAETYKIAIVATNQILTDPGQMFGDPNKPVGGNVVGHTPTYILYIRKSGKKRVVRITKSPHQAETEVVFMLTEEGIGDVET